MSCPNATSPIDITKNTDSICDLKCEYSFKYPTTNLQVANRGEYLSFRTDPSREPPVIYNADKYDVSEIRLYGPSLHTYGGKHAACELMIVHTNMNSSGNLIVCVPMKAVPMTTGLTTLDNVISQISKTATSAGQQTSVNLPSFSLNEIVPRKPYYSYSGTLPYTPCNGSYNYVVFHMDDAISINVSSILKLGKIITPQAYKPKKVKGGLYYNKTGPKKYKNTIEDDIYIECKPTGSEGESIVTTDTPLFGDILSSDMLNQTLSNKVIGILIGIALMLGLMKLAHYLISKIPANALKSQNGGMANISKK